MFQQKVNPFSGQLNERINARTYNQITYLLFTLCKIRNYTLHELEYIMQCAKASKLIFIFDNFWSLILLSLFISCFVSLSSLFSYLNIYHPYSFYVFCFIDSISVEFYYCFIHIDLLFEAILCLCVNEFQRWLIKQTIKRKWQEIIKFRIQTMWASIMRTNCKLITYKAKNIPYNFSS